MRADYTGIIEVGSYTSRRAPHHITLRNITIEASCTGSATTASGNTLDHAFYIGQALDPGPTTWPSRTSPFAARGTWPQRSTSTTAPIAARPR